MESSDRVADCTLAPSRVALGRIERAELRAGWPRSGSPIRIAQKPEKNRHLPERFSVRPPIRVRARHKRLGETTPTVGWLEMVDCFVVRYINRKFRS